MAIGLMVLARPDTWLRNTAPAMASHGYRASSAQKTASAAISLGIVGLVGVALVTALVVPVIAPDYGDPIDATNIPITVDPVPPEPDARPNEQPEASSHITLVTPLRPSVDEGFTVPIGPIEIASPQPRIEPGFTERSGPVPVPPVLRPAQRDTRFIRDFQPPYPAARQREGVEGSCRVSVAISPAGRVTGVQNLACPDDAFFRATERQALRSWRFNPATRDGVPVAATLEQNVVFRMPEE